jgi:ribosomal protein S18 acetylase RimI-like enzyme
MPELRIDPCVPADLPVVSRLAHAIWWAHYPGILTSGQIEYMLARGYSDDALRVFLDTPDAGLALARTPDEPAGFVAWYPIDAVTTKLDKLYVQPERHGQGIGRRLIAHVEAAARAAGRTDLVLNVNKHNAKAIDAYRRAGFAVRESVVVPIGNGYVMDDYVLGKALA